MNALGAEFRRAFDLARSYWVDYVADLVLYSLGFLLLMAIYLVAAGDSFQSELYLSTLIGYITWKVGASTMVAVAYTIADESKTGTLEQLFITGQSPAMLIFRRGFSRFIDYGLRGIVLGGLLAALLGVLRAIPLSALLFFILSVGGAFGLGFALAGLVLVFKRISGLLNLTWQMLVFFSGALAPIPQSLLGILSKFLPLSWGIEAMRAVLLENASLRNLWEAGIVTGMLVNTAAYIALGLLVFHWGYRRARAAGTLGQY